MLEPVPLLLLSPSERIKVISFFVCLYLFVVVVLCVCVCLCVCVYVCVMK